MSSFVVTRKQKSRRRSASTTPVGFFARFVFYLGLGAAIGLGSAWYLLDNGISLDREYVGPWVIRTDAGQPVADPYTSAYIARQGHIPIRLEGGMYFFAEATADGEPLVSECQYLVEGPALSGAWWAVSLHRPDGSLVENPAQRYSFSRTTLVFEDNGTYRISISPRARPGNWLPSGDDGPFVLMLQINGPDPSYVRQPTSVPMPTIALEGCS